MKRPVQICVVSDIHLGTYACHAKELLNYLKSIKPEILILNGDILDVWQFRSRHFPQVQQDLIYEIFRKSRKGTQVYYLTGNHDSFLRCYPELKKGSFQLRNSLSLELDTGKALFLHGDKYDFSVSKFPRLAKIGGLAYDSLVYINTVVNNYLRTKGIGRLNISKTLKSSVKRAVKFMYDYEMSIINQAVNEGYSYVVCGHIHKAKVEKHEINNQLIHYLNSGDWIESLTALEYNNSTWSIYHYDELEFAIKKIEKKAAKKYSKKQSIAKTTKVKL